MHYVVYLKDLDLFESLYALCGDNLVRTVDALRQAVAKGDEPFEAVRVWIDKHRQERAVAAH